MTKKAIQESRRPAHPRLKFTVDVLLLAGAVLLVVKLVTLLLNKFASKDIALFGVPVELRPLVLMIAGGVASDTLKKKYKSD